MRLYLQNGSVNYKGLHEEKGRFIALSLHLVALNPKNARSLETSLPSSRPGAEGSPHIHTEQVTLEKEAHTEVQVTVSAEELCSVAGSQGDND